MRPWALALALGVLIAVVLLGLGALALLRGGISARPDPSAMEVAVARRVRHLAIPESFKAMENPVRSSDDVLRQARAHFADHCASCHGNDGKGMTLLGRSFYPRAPDLTAPTTQDLPDGELFYIIEHGVRFTAMPGFGASGRPEESWKLVQFIRHLPKLTDAELREMGRLNPRSPGEWREQLEEDEFLGESSPGPMEHGH